MEMREKNSINAPGSFFLITIVGTKMLNAHKRQIVDIQNELECARAKREQFSRIETLMLHRIGLLKTPRDRILYEVIIRTLNRYAKEMLQSRSLT